MASSLVLGSLYENRGPHDELAETASSIQLTPDELAEVRAMKATAAIVMHYRGDDWSAAQIAGLERGFADLGIKVIASTDAEFRAEKQISDIESVLSLKPSVMVSIPTDAAVTASAYQKAAKAGVKLVFIDNVPNDMRPGDDYVASVSADNVGGGIVAAHLMATALNSAGRIGLLTHDADFFVTRQRIEGFKSAIGNSYPKIDIVAEKGIIGPAFVDQARAHAYAMLTIHREIDGVWAVWDLLAEGVVAAARVLNRPDLAITTHDLGKKVAVLLAKNTFIKGVAAQRPFDQGLVEAKLAAYGLLNKQAPPYLILPVLITTQKNVMQSWRDVYHMDPPPELSSAERA